MLYLISFALGCVLTYLMTILSTSIKSSRILEESAKTFALLVMSGYEANSQQVEILIVNNNMNKEQAKFLRKKSEESFENYVDNKINIINQNIPPSHHNIIKFKNFKELKLYVANTALKHRRRK